MRSSHGPTNRESEASGQKRSASSAATEEASEPPPQKLLQNAEWPVALPPPIHTNSQNAVVIVSLMAGNSHWDWTVHSGGAAHEFEGTIPWRHAAPISTEQLTLRHVFPEILYPPLFGSTEFTTQSAAAFRRSARVPMIYVYIVSTNEKNESILGSIFHGIPCLLYKLSARDFFPDDNDATTTAVHLYPTLGVDRVVNIAAAQALRPEASAILVLDGGTALTFTTLQPKDIPPTPFRDETDPSRTTTTKSPEMQLTGGIAPGLRLKFSALHDYTNDLPLVTHHQLAAVLDECQETHVSMSVFQSPILDQNTDNNDVSSTDPLSSSQQAKAIIASIMTESALFLCSIVRGWMARVQSQPRTTTTTTATSDGDLNKRLPFLVTCGGDGEAYMKLLQPMHSHVCKISKANQTLLESGLTIQESDIGGNVGVVSSTEESDGRYGGKKFCLLHCNSLPHFGIQQALLKRRQKHAEEHGNEEARFQLVGQRVAVHHPLRKNQIVYGTISEITRRGKTQDEDLYSVVYDETDQIDDLNITTIYGALQLYVSHGEKTKPKDSEEIKIRFLNKLVDAKEAVAALNISCEKIRKLTEAVTTTQSAKAPQSVSNPQASTAPPAAKKRKVSKYAVLLDNPTALVRKRVAKYFGMRKIQTLYFGTVTEYSADNKWWHILYDDEDSEDIGHKELYDALSLYEEHKNEDPNV